ncbi:electron transfer flavoprotein subunit beta/FixA family protein [Heliorestis acidaminivorans]|uniref:Electron transfer flavoprotein small subunit n=1 Tax=Heliorestis acidaminivorans TaxID=553427 RepID=A0A6I0F7X8_9FIRM|nr:electron transfer flavoprotein subunit beta/FixA family protein [Heliorestis acidaminivorans]KAB2953503.1 electron transfer flavoprotein subunit beta/FixA family protein [Heliorestis acidaminivorans]
MNIAVCLKQVPDTSEVRLDPKTNTLKREGIPSIINPYDAHALEEALTLRDQVGGQVIVLSMGPPQAVQSLKKAISYGADRAILLTDRVFAGSDTLATSYILTGALQKLMQEEPIDLILCGKQAIDGDTAQVGPGIASRLGWPLLTYVSKVEKISPQAREIMVHRKLEEGREVLRASLPALLTVVKEINEIRYAPLPDLIRGATYAVEIWNNEDLHLDPTQLGLKGSPTWVSKTGTPPLREKGEMLGKDQASSAQIASLLAERLIPDIVVPNR